MKNKIKLGMVVLSVKGYDKNSIYVVKDLTDNYAYLINGLTKPFNKPKKKNLKHLKSFSVICELDELNINKTNEEVHKLVKIFEKALKNF